MEETWRPSSHSNSPFPVFQYCKLNLGTNLYFLTYDSILFENCEHPLFHTICFPCPSLSVVSHFQLLFPQGERMFSSFYIKAYLLTMSISKMWSTIYIDTRKFPRVMPHAVRNLKAYLFVLYGDWHTRLYILYNS